MKTLLIPIISAAALMVGLSPLAEAGPHRAQHSNEYFSGYRSCGTPIYKQRFVAGYDRCGNPIWRYRVIHPREYGHGNKQRHWNQRARYDRGGGYCNPHDRHRNGIVISGSFRL